MYSVRLDIREQPATGDWRLATDIRILFLWHMHQPFYKDLVTGEYRLPWVRLHALKDYYGMVKLLDEFPGVHQTFNLVPSLLAQIEEYAAGAARDPLLDVAAKPARELSPDERRMALEWLFAANAVHMIGRYPRYQGLWERFRGQNPARAEQFFSTQDITDLQVLSQLAWFDEFFLEEPEIAALVRKGRDFSEDEQRFVVSRERELIARVIPAYQQAASRGEIEVSTSPFYHPILPLLCDTNAGAASNPGLRLPERRFRHPEDAREQLQRGLDLHERLFGRRPVGVWPSEGSVSPEVLEIAHGLGIQWMATDEGVLGRSLGANFERDSDGRLASAAAQKLYTLYRYEQGTTQMHLVFRDHALSDVIGFVYAGMKPQEAVTHFIRSIKESAQSLVNAGHEAVVPVILDGENAWETYPRSGREFLRRLYDAIARDPQLQALTIAEAIARQREFAPLRDLVPGSWINANFNVWIGAPEDNRSWDYLSAARDFYGQAAAASEAQRKLAFEEILIAEGSDWNWWYGPEHHSAHDREFDELYRKHLSNVYQALGANPPEFLAQPIAAGVARPWFVPQTAYIHPNIEANFARYFDWLGAAMYTAERHAGSMHGKQFVLDAAYAGIDETDLYGRLDFVGGIPAGEFRVLVRCETVDPRAGERAAIGAARLEAVVTNRSLSSWTLRRPDSDEKLAGSAGPQRDARVSLFKNFEFKLPLAMVSAAPGTLVRLRFSVWRDHLPLDALPLEGWIELRVVSEYELEGDIYNYSPGS
jgi:alpha-amylase/alpha-mannosidase (GH57 family)